jgi:Flp pilus assembly pilin Flp
MHESALRVIAMKSIAGKGIQGMIKRLLLKLAVSIHRDPKGQGLVEYLLIAGVIALAAMAGMNKLASGINSAFSEIASVLGNYVT